MCKANENMVSKVAELMELRKMIEELQTEAETITVCFATPKRIKLQ